MGDDYGRQFASSSTNGAQEVGQASTWISMLWYSIAPAAAGALVAFIVLWVAHARGLHFAGSRPRNFRLYSRLVTVVLAIVAIVFARASIDYWTVMSFFGSRRVPLAPDAWRDQVFAHTLPFYLFDLPFYSDVLGFVFVLAILCALVFWVTARGWQLADRFQLDQLSRRSTFDLGPRALLLPGASRAGFVPRNRHHTVAWFCGLGFSWQLRASVQLPCLHDGRRLRG